MAPPSGIRFPSFHNLNLFSSNLLWSLALDLWCGFCRSKRGITIVAFRVMHSREEAVAKAKNSLDSSLINLRPLFPNGTTKLFFSSEASLCRWHPGCLQIQGRRNRSGRSGDRRTKFCAETFMYYIWAALSICFSIDSIDLSILSMVLVTNIHVHEVVAQTQSWTSFDRALCWLLSHFTQKLPLERSLKSNIF